MLDNDSADFSSFTEVQKHTDICTDGCVCLPPLPLIDAGKYACALAPKTTPRCIPATTIYEQLPKKKDANLAARSGGYEALGWGVHF
ncbi:hypothetical protein B0T25DRAFT_569563 [Lasiosphaeria hispida]|uniref:Uncharacterized protein n=1 Tax=Lasiosphaeria hispida TaxID=260671 RepID=A0AAJ0MBU1_9PEZI|nr:hypothetical protein B0T25DRAFT_569563 [Lasiosphaeria hispida]